MIDTNTLERLRTLKLTGFVEALIAQQQTPKCYDLPFDERLALLVDAEHTHRLNVRTRRLIKEAGLSANVALDDVDFKIPRMLKKALFLEVLGGSWLSNGTNVIVSGATGLGKTFLASVLVNTFCARGVKVRFKTTHRWLADFLLIEERRRFPQAIARYRQVPVLVFDEWLRDPISPPEGRLLLDLFDDRYRKLSCMFISQIHSKEWFPRFQDPTQADAILDRIVHNSVKIELAGESVRKTRFGCRIGLDDGRQ